jgi:hypothetical protein
MFGLGSLAAARLRYVVAAAPIPGPTRAADAVTGTGADQLAVELGYAR